MKFIMNKNLGSNSKNIVYVIECSKSKKVYVGSTQIFNSRRSLHKSNMFTRKQNSMFQNIYTNAATECLE